MADEISNMLDEEINTGFEKIKDMTPGSDEHMRAVQTYERLYKLRQEDIAKEREFMDRSERSAVDEQERQVKHKQQFWDRVMNCLDVGVKIAGIAVPAVIYAVFMDRGYKFEETGTYTSQNMKGLMGWYKPKK